MHKIFVLLFMSVILSYFNHSYASPPEKRTALVIGNGSYQDGPLKNAPNDAISIGQTLQKLGFELVQNKVHINMTKEQMSLLILEMGDQLKMGKGVGLFYFSGHGIQFEGQNYLIPVDAKLDREEYVKIYGVPLDQISSQFEQVGNEMNLMILDACRNNPFASKYRSATRGFKLQQAASGTLIFYATKPGEVSLDGDGDNSPFTTSLIQNMQTPGLKIEEVLKETIKEVKTVTKGKQVPWQEGFILNDFYFVNQNEATSTTSRVMATNSISQTLTQSRLSKRPSLLQSLPHFTYYSLGLGILAHALNLNLSDPSMVNPLFYATYLGYTGSVIGLGVGSYRYLQSPSPAYTTRPMTANAQPSILFPISVGTF